MLKKEQPFRAELITKGRKSGKEHSVWLLAVMHNGKVYFSRHRPDGDWFQNALENSDVLVKYDDTTIQGKAILVKDESLAKKISELKYPGQERAKEQRVALEVTLCE
jgi:hypothetical protein